MTDDLVPLDRDQVARFITERGEFTVPADLFDDGREHDLAVFWATHLPTPNRWALTSSRTHHRDGSVSVRWRRTRVVITDA